MPIIAAVSPAGSYGPLVTAMLDTQRQIVLSRKSGFYRHEVRLGEWQDDRKAAEFRAWCASSLRGAYRMHTAAMGDLLLFLADRRDAVHLQLRWGAQVTMQTLKTEADAGDETAVTQFANAMAAKMAASRANGREGWQRCTPADLWAMLREHVDKGDPVDVANFAMMIWHHLHRGEAAS